MFLQIIFIFSYNIPISYIYEKFEVALIVYFCFADRDLDIKRKRLGIQ